MNPVIDGPLEGFIIDTEAQDACISRAEVQREVELDLLADLQTAGLPTYARPRGYASRPISGPVDTGAGQRSH